jgi:hypothetical protein
MIYIWLSSRKSNLMIVTVTNGLVYLIDIIYLIVLSLSLEFSLQLAHQRSFYLDKCTSESWSIIMKIQQHLDYYPRYPLTCR